MKAQDRVLFCLVLMPFALTAQMRQPDVVPLKHWAAPPYWQLSASERDAAGVTPRAQSAPNSLVFALQAVRELNGENRALQSHIEALEAAQER